MNYLIDGCLILFCFGVVAVVCQMICAVSYFTNKK
jgi:hypothetical protein